MNSGRSLQPNRFGVLVLVLTVPALVVFIVISALYYSPIACGGGNALANFLDSPHYGGEIAAMQRALANSPSGNDLSVRGIRGRQMVLVVKHRIDSAEAADKYLFGSVDLQSTWQAIYLSSHTDQWQNTATNVIVLFDPSDASDDQLFAARYEPRGCTPI